MRWILRLLKYFLFTILFTSCSGFELGRTSNKPKSIGELASYGEKVRQRIVDNIPNLRFCLEKFLPPMNNNFKGTVNFRFFINSHGMVKNVSVTSAQLQSLKVKGCLVKTITTLEMPKHNKGQDFQVNQPLGFSLQ